jgi:mRNA-degrading endonuclease toxin of MazEF toxin-antitoxin module
MNRRPQPRRGDIFHLEIAKSEILGGEQYGYRGWVIVSADSINRGVDPETVVAVPLTSKVHRAEGNYRFFRILIPAKEFIPEPGFGGKFADSLALTEQVRVLSIPRIPVNRSGRLTPKAMAAVEAGLAYVLDIPKE